jgi:hypothetical protein
VTGDLDAFRENIRTLDAWLDASVSPAYRGQPLAQDWLRVAKLAEELGEATQVLISLTAGNPRKGNEGFTPDDLVKELADVSLTALYAIQHFVKDEERAVAVLLGRCQAHVDRVPR